VGICTRIIALVGQMLVALVIAQFAGRIPLSGSTYQWRPCSPASASSCRGSANSFPGIALSDYGGHTDAMTSNDVYGRLGDD
jgi:hypothetical protein